MDSVDFENDFSTICHTHSLKLKRNLKNISLILIYQTSYEVIEIKIFETSSNKLIGREIFTYSDIFEIFENYFLCFNEDMFNIYTFLNNCFLLKKYQANINESSKQINIELFILKDCAVFIKTINITTCQDFDGYKKISDKIRELNYNMNSNKIEKNYRVAPVNFIKYENDLYFCYFEIILEKEIDVLGIKAQVIHKGEENNINYLNNKYNNIYSSYYSLDELDIATKNYYQPILYLEEISKEIIINFYNKNIKIEGITEEKMKLKIKVVSSTMNISDIDINLLKNSNIKEKYMEIITELKLKNEYLIKREIYQDCQDKKLEEKDKNNTSISLYDCALSNDSNFLSIENSLANSHISQEKKFLEKKREYCETSEYKNPKKRKKNKKSKNYNKENSNQKRKEYKYNDTKGNENISQNYYNELYQQLIKHERERLSNISEQLFDSD